MYHSHAPNHLFLGFFFFSSRRRHTIFDCDWSSDVCSSDLDVNFQFLKQGIQIRSNWFPIVKMQWAKGDLLHSHIEKNLGYPAVLAALRAKWAILVRHLEAAQVAHGDLQHGNILVRGGSIQLVDYDG